MFGKLTALTATLALALAGAAPALAQAPAASAEDGTVNVTFQLDFEGEVPGWQNFGVDHSLGGEAPIDMMLCTTGAEAGGPDSPLCEPGQTYAGSMEVPAGEPVSFDFVRHDTRTQPEHFQSETRAFSEDATVTATYYFPSGPVEPEPPQNEAPESENSPDEDPQNEAPRNETPGAETPSEKPVPESAPEHQYTASEGAASAGASSGAAGTGSGTAPAGEPEAPAAETPAAEAPAMETPDAGASEEAAAGSSEEAGGVSGDEGPALLPETSGAPVVLVAGLLLLAGGLGILAYRRVL